MSLHRPGHQTPAFYPITIFWLISAAVLALTVAGFFTVALAIVFLAVCAVWLIMYATWRETRSVHTLVNGQKHELMTEIADLKNLLREKDVQVPASPAEKRDRTRGDRTKEVGGL